MRVNKNILETKNFTSKDIKLITKYYDYLINKNIYTINESYIINLIDFINNIQDVITLKFINSYILNFKINKTQNDINIDLLNSYL